MPTRVARGDVIHIVPDAGPERRMLVTHVEHHIIALSDLPEPVPVEELAELNPDLDERGLARLQAFEQLLAEDDAASGYQDPECE